VHEAAPGPRDRPRRAGGIAYEGQLRERAPRRLDLARAMCPVVAGDRGGEQVDRRVARARIGELVPIEEKRVERRVLERRSLFVANAARGIVEVAALDGVPCPGSAATRALQARFWP